ncbi:MAG TPA: hypothetical protein PLA27_15230, partial [Anaerolineales bacterium]|nr:hypothetical protein [Anaerolineales bacterium]
MNERSYLPDSNRIGVLTSTVLLALALARVIQSPEFDLELQLPGFFLSIPLNIPIIMSLLTAGSPPPAWTGSCAGIPPSA